MSLATDLNNPEFVNPQNPDALHHAEFYMFEPIDKWESENQTSIQGKRVVIKRPKQPFVRIMSPASKDNIIEVAVREEHKMRWPDKWHYFMLSEGMIEDGKDIPGWKLEEWPHLDSKHDFLRDLKYMRFHTVEQIAGATDAQVQRMGMGGMGLREQARVDLRERVTKEVSGQIAAKDKVIAEQGNAIAALQKQMADLMDSMTRPQKKASG